VVRVVKQIGARLPVLLAPLAGTLAGAGRPPEPDAAPPIPQNGFGGLTPDGQYEIGVSGDRLPPAPWSNVIANPHGGFLVTERGGGFTWAANPGTTTR
jgi:cyclic beta-1,2-glucan synthetase